VVVVAETRSSHHDIGDWNGYSMNFGSLHGTDLFSFNGVFLASRIPRTEELVIFLYIIPGVQIDFVDIDWSGGVCGRRCSRVSSSA